MIFSIEESVLFVTCQMGGLHAYNVATGVVIQSLDVNAYNAQVLNRSTMYVAQGNKELVIYDISDYSNIKKISDFNNTILKPKVFEYFLYIYIEPSLRYAFLTEELNFQIYDISNLQNPIVIMDGYIPKSAGMVNSVGHPSKSIVFFQSRGGQVHSIDYSKFPGKTYPLPLEFDGIIPSQGITATNLDISHDGNMLFTAEQGVQVIIIECSDHYNMKIFQIIPILGTIQYMFLSKTDSKYIYAVLQREVQVYQKTNLTQPIYNLFTDSSAILLKDPQQGFWPWDITFNKEGNIFFHTDGGGTLKAFDVSNAPQISQKGILQKTSTQRGYNNVRAALNENIIYFGGFSIFTVNVTDVTNMYSVGELQNANARSMTIFENEEILLAALGQKVHLIQTTDYKTLDIIATLEDPFKIVGPYIVKLTIELGNKYIFSTSYDTGYIWIAEVSDDRREVKVISYEKVIFAREFRRSKKHENIGYVLSAPEGIIIYNYGKDFKTYKIISSLKLNGSMWSMEIDPHELVIFIPSTVHNSLFTVDISDINNPVLMHTLNLNLKIPMVGFTTVKGKGAYLAMGVLSEGMLVLPLQITIRLKVEFYKVEKQQVQLIEQKQDQEYMKFKVGENFFILVDNLDDPQTKVIEGFYYYTPTQPGVYKETKKNIDFDIAQKKITVTTDQGLLGLNTIVVKVLKAISKDEINQVIFAGNDDAQSQTIYDQIYQFGYINLQGYPTKLFNPSTNIDMANDQLQQYSTKVKDILKTKINIFPIYFHISASLEFNPHIKELNSEQNLYIVNSAVDRLDITFKVNFDNAVFFNQQFQGVIIYYSGSMDEVTITGSIISINQFLSHLKLEIKQKENMDEIPIEVLIKDSLNNDYLEAFTFSQLTFLKKNEYVERGDSIQKQFNQQFEGGEVYIKQQFSFQFSSNSFKDDDNYEIQLFLKQNKKLLKITNMASIDDCQYSFDQSSRTLRGICGNQMYRKKQKIIIKAGDGFSSASQELLIYYGKIPPFEVLTIVIYFISSFLTIFGLFKYRGALYQIFCKSKYDEGNLYVTEGSEFLIQVLLNKNSMRAGQIQFKQFLNYCKKNKIDISEVLINQDLKRLEFQKSKVVKILKEVNPNIKEQGYEEDSTLNFMIFKCLFLQQLLTSKQFDKERKILQLLKKQVIQTEKINQLRWFEAFTTINPISIEDNNNCLPLLRVNIKKLQIAVLKVLENHNSTMYQENDQYTNKLFDIQEPEFFSAVQNLGNNLDINFALIVHMIIVYTFGLTKISFLSPHFARGQCITKTIQNVKTVKAMKETTSIFKPLLKLINFHYVTIPFSENQPLPSWCDYKYSHNVLEIFGTMPINVSDEEKSSKLIIRIVDQNNMPLKQLNICFTNDNLQRSQRILVENIYLQKSLSNESHSYHRKSLSEMIQNQKMIHSKILKFPLQKSMKGKQFDIVKEGDIEEDYDEERNYPANSQLNASIGDVVPDHEYNASEINVNDNYVMSSIGSPRQLLTEQALTVENLKQ